MGILFRINLGIGKLIYSFGYLKKYEIKIGKGIKVNKLVSLNY